MPFDIDVVSIGGNFDSEIAEAAQVLNGVQDQFRFLPPPSRLLTWGHAKFKKEYLNSEVFKLLEEYLDAAKSGRHYVIGVVDQYLHSKKTENLFGSRRLKPRREGEGMAVVTLRDWASFTESARQFLCYYMIRYALSFLAPKLQSHEETRGCFFDFKRKKSDLRLSLETGALCAEHKEQLAEVFTEEISEAFQKMTRAMRGLRQDAAEEIAADSLKGQIDIGIITMKPEEYRAVLDRFPRRRKVIGRTSNYLYTRIVTQRRNELRLVIGRTATQAQGAAMSLAVSMLTDLRPRWLLVVGIAGGVPATEFSLGDVLLSQRMHDFSVGSKNPDGTAEFENLGSPMAVEVDKLLKDFPDWESKFHDWSTRALVGCTRPKMKVPINIDDERLYGPDAWKKKVIGVLKANFTAKNKLRNPIALPATIISSNTLVKNVELLKEWLLSVRQSLGVEMELAGVMGAARTVGDKDTCVMAIRGISDIVGFKRGPEWTEFACQSAAALTYALLASGEIQPTR